jgi:non-specific serine/threonine protein kinase/serine/threonine-protein kinase
MSGHDPVRVEELFHAAADLQGAEREDLLRLACGTDAEMRRLVDSLLAADCDPASLPSPVASTAERWARVSAIAREALDLPPGERTPFLAQACRSDSQLLPEVEERLASLQVSPIGRDVLDSGTQIGSWRLIRELGRGGMGTVYLAERADGQFHQQAALKVTGVGFLGSGLIRRFLRERQILARLDHPAIARLLDGGVTSGNRPWFVLEYVDGARIDRYCQERRLSVRERLGLFLQVCGAVQYAHENLVIHCDIKPANILVASTGQTGSGQAGLHQIKLLDFGIANLLADHVEFDAAQHTRTGRLLTLDYASPEQARGEPVNTRTDIYSLGTLLYELLAGRHPLGTSKGSMLETARRLQETEPARPSEVAVHPPDRDVLRGDLDRIVLAAMQKEPARRYSSVEAFAADIQRYLDGFPVSARGDSYSYRAGKFIRRNRTLVAAAVLLALIVTASMAALVRSAAATERQRVRAERRFGEIREVARALIFDIDPVLQGIPGTTAVRKLINVRALTYLDRLSADATGDVALERDLATGYAHLAMVQGVPLYANLGDEAGARSSLNKSLQLLGASLAADPGNADGVIQRVRTLQLLGEMELFSGDPAAALPAHRQALREISALLARTAHLTGKMLNAAAASNLELAADHAGNMGYANLGDPGAAIPLFARALDLYKKEAAVRESQPNPKVMNLYQFSNQAVLELQLSSLYLIQLCRPAEARTHAERALDLLQSRGNDLTDTEIKRKLMLAEALRARILLEQGDVAPAVESSESAAKMADELLRTDPINQVARTDRLIAEVSAGWAEATAGRTTTGFARIDRALHEAESTGDFASGYFRSTLTTNYLYAGTADITGGRYEMAGRHFARAAELAGATMDQHPSDVKAKFDFSTAELGLASCVAHRGNKAAAAEHRALAAAVARKVLNLHPDNPRAQKLLAEASTR